MKPRPTDARRRSTRPAGASALAALALAALIGVGACLPGSTPGGSAAPTPSDVAGSPSATPLPSFVRPTPTPRPTFLAYVVHTGDSLISIARRHDTTARSIAFWNRATYPSLDPESEAYDPDRIGVGWTLLIIPGAVYEPADVPSPTPGPPSASPTVPAVTPPATTSPSAGPSTVVSHGPRGTTRVALTFDMGGRLDPAVEIMDWLIANGVKATIFPTGLSGTTTDLGLLVLARVRDHPELFDLANHSWDHPNFTELTAAEMADQLQRTEDALAPIVGRTTRPWFRPPFGAWTAAVREGVGQAGWGYTVMWDIDTIDWRPTSDGGPTATDIVAKVLSRAEGGSIVLMHLGGWNTLEALPGILAGLRERGLEPVTLSEMFGG
jgi:peptidoglycan/xylan/chitin deacetylase (PgdA/CDA1 family)